MQKSNRQSTNTILRSALFIVLDTRRLILIDNSGIIDD